MELTEKELQVPIIKINYEELKEELGKSLKEYEGLVVTAETLAGCKNAQKELASLRTKVDAYRKDKKKELSAPITAFENQCKELVKMIEAVEAPIKEGIKVFDDLKRDEKKGIAEQIIAEVIEKVGLKDKYAQQLTVIDKYLNLTATKKAVQEDVETRAFALKVEQDREEERLTIIQSVIDSENERITTKLNINQFSYFINSGMPTSDIITEIKKRAASIYEAENQPIEEAVEQPTEPPVEEPKEEKVEETEEAKTAPRCFSVTIKIIGSMNELKEVSAFLKSKGVNYEKLEQKEVI